MLVDAEDRAVFEGVQGRGRTAAAQQRPADLQLAKELGASERSLRNGSRQVDVDDDRVPGLASDEREELRRLRRENRILAEERADSLVVATP